MADTAAPAKGFGATLGKKVGPLPLGVWLAAGLGVWWYLKKQQAASTSQNPAAQQSQTGYGTDPAGNTGYIDPSTGYVYGSAEDIAALQSQGLVGANSYNTGGDGSTSGTGASGSSLAPTGTTATGATTGTTNASGTSTTTPGTSSAPASTSGAAAASSKSWRYPAPSGLSASSVSDSGFRLSWSGVQGPNGQRPSTYAVAVYQQNGTKVSQHNVNTTSSIEYGPGGVGLKPSTSYKVQVWANGGPLAPPGANIVVTTKPKGTK